MVWLARLSAAAVCVWLGQAAAQAPSGTPPSALLRLGLPAAWPSDPLQLARELVARRGNTGRPFAVVDKRGAQVFVFNPSGELIGRSAALLGRALGDATPPGVGLRTQQGQLRDDDRTTPAGQFDSEPGRNHEGESVVWVDYDAALAIHRVRGGPDRANRLRRLASPDPASRRVSAGCVVVPEAFYDRVIHPLLGRRRGWVLVMPEAVG